jgi:hypothetical protein
VLSREASVQAYEYPLNALEGGREIRVLSFGLEGEDLRDSGTLPSSPNSFRPFQVIKPSVEGGD